MTVNVGVEGLIPDRAISGFAEMDPFTLFRVRLQGSYVKVVHLSVVPSKHPLRFTSYCKLRGQRQEVGTWSTSEKMIECPPEFHLHDAA